MQTTPVPTTSDKSGVRVGQVRDESPQESQILVANPGRPDDTEGYLSKCSLFCFSKAAQIIQMLETNTKSMTEISEVNEAMRERSSEGAISSLMGPHRSGGGMWCFGVRTCD